MPSQKINHHFYLQCISQNSEKCRAFLHRPRTKASFITIHHTLSRIKLSLPYKKKYKELLTLYINYLRAPWLNTSFWKDFHYWEELCLPVVVFAEAWGPIKMGTREGTDRAVRNSPSQISPEQNVLFWVQDKSPSYWVQSFKVSDRNGSSVVNYLRARTVSSFAHHCIPATLQMLSKYELKEEGGSLYRVQI